MRTTTRRNAQAKFRQHMSARRALGLPAERYVAAVPGAYGGYVKSHEASNELVSNFSRDPSKFALNKYITLVPAKKMTGYWLEMTVEEAGRIVGDDSGRNDWPDGAPRPSLSHNDNREESEYKDFRCRRKEYGAAIGNLTSSQASYDLIVQQGKLLMQKAMTARTKKVLDLLTNSANYLTGHSGAVASITGNTGTWAASTRARQDIQRSINHAARKIELATLGVVEKSDLVLVLNPVAASNISESDEIHGMLAGSPDAKPYIEQANWRNRNWGIPDYLAGVETVVENAVEVTTNKGVTTSKSYVMPDAKAALVARPGKLEGVEGSPSFSSVSLFAFGHTGEAYNSNVNSEGDAADGTDLSVFTYQDVPNERELVSVVDNLDVKMTAPLSAYLFESIV